MQYIMYRVCTLCACTYVYKCGWGCVSVGVVYTYCICYIQYVHVILYAVEKIHGIRVAMSVLSKCGRLHYL